MKTIRGILLFCLLILTVVAHSQRILLVEKAGKFKNYKYAVGDNITVRTHPYGEKHSGTLHEVTDTSILLNFDDEIMLKDIQRIIRPRWGLSFVSKITRIAGAGYFVLDVVNNAITGNPTIVDKTTLLISGGLVAFSYALVPLQNKRIKPGDTWRIKVLNMSMDEEPPNPFRR